MKKILMLGVAMLVALSCFVFVANASICVDSIDLNLVDYDSHLGAPNQCDCDGNCWDSYGFWYADPDYTGADFVWGSPASVDGWGNGWNNYGFWYEDTFYPHANTPEHPVYEDPIIDDGSGWSPYDSFWDVGSGDEYYTQVNYVGELGVFDGYDDGSYQPYNAINRVST